MPSVTTYSFVKGDILVIDISMNWFTQQGSPHVAGIFAYPKGTQMLMLSSSDEFLWERASLSHVKRFPVLVGGVITCFTLVCYGTKMENEGCSFPWVYKLLQK